MENRGKGTHGEDGGSRGPPVHQHLASDYLPTQEAALTFLPFMDDDSEAQRGQVLCLRSHSPYTADQTWGPGLFAALALSRKTPAQHGYWVLPNSTPLFPAF